MSAKNIDAVVAGLACLDFTPVFVTKETHHIEQLLIPSKTVLMGKADIHAGGCVSNTGLAMCRFGVNARLVTKLGNDEFAEMILHQYEQYAPTDTIIRSDGGEDGAGTSYSVVLAPAGIDRIFLHYPGVNDTFGPEDLDYDLAGSAKLFHFGYPPAMARMYRNDGKELVEILRRVKERDVTTSVDTTSVDANSEAGRADWDKILRDSMPYIDIFVPSVEELCFMLDKERFAEWTKRAGEADIASVLEEEDIRPLADRLLSYGAKVLMIKCGSKGLYFATGSREKLSEAGSDLRDLLVSWADKRYFQHSYKPREILSATGAGDTCIAAFLTAVLRGYTWERCLRCAAAMGAACCESYDSLSGLPSFAELEKKIDEGWEQNP